jgi:Uma2 family endonuclease
MTWFSKGAIAMIQAKPRFSNFEEYLSYDDGTDKRYELFNGELIELPPESGENSGILSFVHFQLVLLMGHRKSSMGSGT